MNSRIIIAVLAVVLSLGIGQLLFKASAMAWAAEKTLFSSTVYWRLIPALAVYAAATVAWIWVLQFVPLKTAYPFMALSFVIVPLASRVVFAEHVQPAYWLGAGLIIAGVLVTAVTDRS